MVCEFSFPTRIMHGAGSLGSFVQYLHRKQDGPYLLVVDQGLIELGLAQRLLDLLAEYNLITTTFSSFSRMWKWYLRNVDSINVFSSKRFALGPSQPFQHTALRSQT